MFLFKKYISVNKFVLCPYLLIVCVFLFLNAECLKAQVYTAGVKMDTTKILIGDQTKLTLSVRVPSEILGSKKTFLKWHTLKDTISQNIEIVNSSNIDTTLSADKKTYLLSQELTITSFDSGFFVIPPFRFLRNGDSLKYIETQALLLEVISLAVDTSQVIKDIKPPLESPFTLSEILPYILIGLLISAVIVLIVYLIFKRRKKKTLIFEKEIIIPPHEKAITSLQELKAKKLWQEGKSKEYHTIITEIIRTYIEERFKIMALEKTTEEIITSFRSLDIPDDSKLKLKQILTLADIVKFAKINPMPDENELSFSNALDFVNSTIPKIEIVEIEEKGGQA